MKYTVRSQDGELVFSSFREVENAFWSGLIDPEDEVQEEGASTWRKAESFPVLRGAGPSTLEDQQKEKFLLAFAVVLATVALGALLSKGHAVIRYGITAVVTVLLVGVLNRIVNVTANRRQAMRRSPPTGRR